MSTNEEGLRGGSRGDKPVFIEENQQVRPESVEFSKDFVRFYTHMLAWPLNGSEAVGDLVLTQTSLGSVKRDR